MKKIILVCCVGLLPFFVLAQKGIVKGKVSDSKTGETIVGVIVKIEGTNIGAITDFEGNYRITLSPGKYTIIYKDIVFSEKKIQNIIIESGKETIQNIKLEEDVKSLQEVVVEGKTIKNTDISILNLQKESLGVADGISFQSIAKSGDGDVAAGIKRVNGISVENGKYIYVRGLGDRYSKVTINGMEIPGLDPDKNTIQLDLIPTSIVDNLMVYKTFTPDLVADFSGGTVDIVTKDFSEQETFKVSVSIGYNPTMHFNDNFLTYNSSNAVLLANGAKSIDLPFDKNQYVPTPGVESKKLEEMTKKFGREMATSKGKSFINQKYTVSYGNQFRGKKYLWGFIGILGYEYQNKLYEDIEYNSYQKDSDKNQYELRILDSEKGAMGVEDVTWNAMANFSVKRGNSKLSLKFLHIKNGTKQAVKLHQTSSSISSTPGSEISKHRLYYRQRSISNILVHFKQKILNEKIDLDVKLSPTFSKITEPDLRQTFFVYDDGKVSIDPGNGGRLTRDFRYLNEKSLHAKTDLKMKVNMLSDLESSLKFGVSYLTKNRKYEILQYYFRDLSGRTDYTGDPNELFLEENLFNAGKIDGVHVLGGPSPSNKYNSIFNIYSAYVMNELVVSKDLKIIYGLRYEKSLMYYTGRRQIPRKDYKNEEVLNFNDILPSISGVYSIKKDFKLRISYANTVARPSFKEKSHIQIFDAFSNRYFLGNINVKPTKISNYDVRVEKYSKGGGLISFSAFYKHFTNPIEIAHYSASSDDLTAINTNKANLYGTELDVRKNLSFITQNLENFFLSFNATYIHSELHMDDTEYKSRLTEARKGENISQKRKMQGQSPYMINASISFKNKKINANLSYNIQGETLAVVGIGEKSDIYRDVFHGLDFKGSIKLGKKRNSSLSFSVKNILGEEKNLVYKSYKGSDQIAEKYISGRTFSISFSTSLLN